MRRAILLLLIAIHGCSPDRSADRMAEMFEKDALVFEQLKKLIIFDAGTRDCFEVGLDRIGEYSEHSGIWSHQRDYKRKLNLSQVLDAEGLSEARYEEYKSALALSESESIGYCHGGKVGPWVRALVMKSGLGVSGCIGFINWRETVPPSYRNGQDFEEIKPLRNGWYVSFACT